MTITIARATKVVDLVTDLGLKAEHDAAVKALIEAQNLDVTDQREVPRQSDAAKAVKALEDRMKASTVRFTLQAMPRKEWIEYVATHLPREGDRADKAYGVNLSTFDEAIFDSIIKIEQPDGTAATLTLDEFRALADEMSNSQWEEFALAVMSLNANLSDRPSENAVPFSLAASVVMLRSATSSKQPSDEGSASSD